MEKITLRFGMLFLALAVLCLTPLPSHAKWWIFGQTENEIATRYLYLNGVSYDELGDKATVYRETLENGLIVLRGKADTKTSQIGSIQVSTDGKATWEKAKKGSDGAFEYSFRPEAGKSYLLYVKIIDTTGKSNDVEATRKELTVSDQNITALIRKTLDGMIAAYQAEEPARFMTYVSDEFAGDPVNLDRAVRKDFASFDNISIRFTLNNVTAGTGGKVFTAITFTRQVTSTKSGKTLRDSGPTEFVFKLGEHGAQVAAMKNPLIFGVSDPEEVATGTSGGASGDYIQITTSGEVVVQPIGSDPVPPPATQGLQIKIDPAQSIKHHQVYLMFMTTEVVPVDTDISLEVAVSPSGPWDSLQTVWPTLPAGVWVGERITNQIIAQQAVLLWFRARLCPPFQNCGAWSNTVMWDNR